MLVKLLSVFLGFKDSFLRKKKQVLNTKFDLLEYTYLSVNVSSANKIRF